MKQNCWLLADCPQKLHVVDNAVHVEKASLMSHHKRSAAELAPAVLQIYALTFFLVPLIRQLLISNRNRQVDSRNDSRNNAQALLKDPTLELERKLHAAREEAKHRRITDRDLVYRSDRNLAEQARDVEAEDFDRRLAQSAGKSSSRDDQGSLDSLSQARRLFRESEGQIT